MGYKNAVFMDRNTAYLVAEVQTIFVGPVTNRLQKSPSIRNVYIMWFSTKIETTIQSFNKISLWKK